MLQEILPIISWPLLILILVLIFRKQITELFGRVTKVSKEGAMFGYDKGLTDLAEQGEKAVDALTVVAEHAKSLFRQGQPYEDYSEAFRDLEKRIRDSINENMKNGIEKPKVKLKLIAVAMTFSWKFIVSKLPKILQQYSTAEIDVEVAFIQPEHLDSLGLAHQEINWTAESQMRINEVKEFAKLCHDQYQGRLKFTAKTYKNLPHWHGWLVNEDFLFLGRTNWQFPNNHPKLLVGQNKYRYFDNTSIEGSERIQLFANWQRYYFQYASEEICSTQN